MGKNTIVIDTLKAGQPQAYHDHEYEYKVTLTYPATKERMYQIVKYIVHPEEENMEDLTMTEISELVWKVKYKIPYTD
jgi:hypothetical protein